MLSAEMPPRQVALLGRCAESTERKVPPNGGPYAVPSDEASSHALSCHYVGRCGMLLSSNDTVGAALC
jgi:hypothetical protein